MSISKKSDVKNHLFPRLQTHLHLSPPESQSAATGFTSVESSASPAGTENFAKENLGDHSLSRAVLGPDIPLTDSFGARLSEASKSARA